MRAVIYFAPAPGAHPVAPPEVYGKLWSVMLWRLRMFGYHLTVLSTPGASVPGRYDARVDYDVDPAECALARELCWASYLESLPTDDEVFMVEPDSYLVRPVPPLAPGKDMVLLRRDKDPVPICYRQCRRDAAVYYRSIATLASLAEPDRKRWYADIDAQQQILGDRRMGMDKLMTLPAKIGGVSIEHRDYRHYCMDDRRSLPDAVMWMFNGAKKKERMLKLAGPR